MVKPSLPLNLDISSLEPRPPEKVSEAPQNGHVGYIGWEREGSERALRAALKRERRKATRTMGFVRGEVEGGTKRSRECFRLDTAESGPERLRGN